MRSQAAKMAVYKISKHTRTNKKKDRLEISYFILFLRMLNN